MKTKKSGTSHASVTVAPSPALFYPAVLPPREVDPLPKKLILSAREEPSEERSLVALDIFHCALTGRGFARSG